MIDRTRYAKSPANLQRRKMLQGAAAVFAVGAAPAMAAGLSSDTTVPNISGKLVCSISDPVKTLVLRNHSNKTVVLDQLSKSALMFDGSIVDCNNAFLSKPVSIPAHEEVEIRFAVRHPRAHVHGIEDYQRVQSRVSRLSDGTRVIPFSASVHGNRAMFV